MGDAPTNPGISRRSALKRIGIGTAAVWSAPMLMSLESRGFAQGSPDPDACDCHTDYYVDQNCDLSKIRECNGNPSCFCSRLDNGSCACAVRIDCTIQNPPGCDDVPCDQQGFPGYLCVETCCDVLAGKPKFQCLPPCPA